MLKIVCITFCVLALSGCAGLPIPYTTVTSFNPDETTSLLADGKNTINGNAFMRQNGGGVVTCAGATVALIPATEYAAERITAIYGNSFEGISRKNVIFKPEPIGYEKFRKTTTCDSLGNFQFESVADGEFFVITRVTWMVGNYNPQGALMMKSVKVTNKQTLKVVMAN